MASRSLGMRFPAVLAVVALSGLFVALSATPAEAQRMDLALARLRVDASDVPDPMTGQVACPTSRAGPDGTPYPQLYCQDDAAWQQLATEFLGALIPPMLTPARTRGPRSFFVGLDTSITPIRASAEYWHRGTEGNADPSGGGINRQVDDVLAWTRITLRKAFPFGFELGTTIGYLVNTSYWALGLEIRWALLEGWLTRDWWVPDIALRGSVQTLVGDQEFNTTVAQADISISESIVIGDAFELTPILTGGIAFLWADSELVDLTPDTSAFGTCSPDPATPTGPSSLCRASGMDYNHNAVFPSIRQMRPRGTIGIQGRYEAFTIMASFAGDLVPPSQWNWGSGFGTSVPTFAGGMSAQWRLDIGLGLSY